MNGKEMIIQTSLDKNKHKTSVNKNYFYDIDIFQNHASIDESVIEKSINEYNVFNDEITLCSKYRLTLSINTITTNVLTNPTTRVFDGELELTGSSLVNAIQTINPNYTYQHGYDIFDNNYLRVDNFKTGNTINDFTGSALQDVKSIEKSM
jgi:hypothetical protein